jgi:methionyl-tRNA synthetase
MLAALRVADGDAPWPADVAAALGALPPGHGFSVPDNLFAKMDDAAREALEARFGGREG